MTATVPSEKMRLNRLRLVASVVTMKLLGRAIPRTPTGSWRTTSGAYRIWNLRSYKLTSRSIAGSNSGEPDTGFSRVRLRRDEKVIALGLLPYRPRHADETVLGRIAIKLS